MPRCLTVVCGCNDYYKLYKEVFEAHLGIFSILKTTEGNRKVKSSICKLCKDEKLTYIDGMNIYPSILSLRDPISKWAELTFVSALLKRCS